MRPLNLLRLLATLLLGPALLPASWAQQPVEGKDYKLIVPAQKPDSGNKIEVIEFFSYACPHCG